MPYICYEKGFIKPQGEAALYKVNNIIQEYARVGFKLTLRQVYYQMVARGFIPNTTQSYNNLGELINRGRMLGIVDWHAIEDRTRYLRSLSHWDSPTEIVESAAAGYQTDLWLNQPYYVEVYVEKDSLVDIVEQVCNKFDVPCFSCRGYASQTAMWDAAQRIITKSNYGEKEAVIIHLGDHDPSGIDMTRDIIDRLRLFATATGNNSNLQSDYIKIDRIALNMDQIKKWRPPPNPAKTTDSRYTAYTAGPGDSSWELDALKPEVMQMLIANAINRYMDADLMQDARDRMGKERALIWDAVGFIESRQEEDA